MTVEHGQSDQRKSLVRPVETPLITNLNSNRQREKNGLEWRNSQVLFGGGSLAEASFPIYLTGQFASHF